MDWEALRGGLIVSCQAPAGDPFRHPQLMAAFAQAAELAGAVGIRANGAEDVAAIRQVVQLPIIGINKQQCEGYPVYITPTLESAREVVQAGATLVAVDATPRRRPGDVSVAQLIAAIHQQLRVPVMADISTYEEGVAAARAGADIVATTLSGYTEESPRLPGPDVELVRRLAQELSVPVICEGRVHSPADLRQVFAAGAFAVVVGTAITRPQWIAEQYVAATPRRQAADAGAARCSSH